LVINLIARFQTFLEKERLISLNDTICLALSGGMDSMAMLSLFLEIRQKYNLTLQAVHVNHGLRGRQSELDQILVQETCQKEGLPLIIRRLQGFTLSSSEEALRSARYDIFNEILKEHPAWEIATAHHLDDQIETLLMRLAKGSYLEGLQGIPVQRPGFIRPLLCFKRSEIEAFVKQNHISYREDVSNQDVRKLRNGIRHRLMPELRNIFGEQVYEGMSKSLAHLRQVNEFISRREERWRQKYLKQTSQQLAFSTADYLQLPPWLRRRLLRYCISALIPVNSTLAKDSFDGFERFVREGKTGAIFYFSAGVSVLKDRGRLMLKVSKNETVAEKELFPDDFVCLGRNKVVAKRVDEKDVRFNKETETEFICGDALRWPLKIRYWRDGDFFYPLGAGGRQKLHKFFIDHKINRWQKQHIPLVCNGEDIVWVAGLRIDSRYKLHSKCRTVYRLSTETIENEEEI